MINYSYRILLTYLFINYHFDEVVSGYIKAVKICAKQIYDDFEYDRRCTFNLKQNISLHAMKYNLENMLYTQNAKDYFNYLKDQIYVDENLPHPGQYCDRLGDGVDATEDYYFFIMIQAEIETLLFEIFLQSEDTLAVAKRAYETLVQSFFTSMLEINYEKQYYYVLMKNTYFNVVTKCIEDIYQDFKYNKKYTHQMPQNLGKYAMTRTREDLLETSFGRQYFNYLKDNIFVDVGLPNPIEYCNGILEDLFPTMGLDDFDKICNEIEICKNSLIDHFLHSDDKLAIVKTACENLLEDTFSIMNDTDYSKMYYYIMVGSTHFSSETLTPTQYCQYFYNNLNKTNIDSQNKNRSRKKRTNTDQESENEQQNVAKKTR